jgi:hypothetical protein
MNNPLIALVGNTKSQIIECLDEKALTLKELNTKLSLLGKDISYQATHKSVNEMISNEILEKIDNKLRINILFLNKLENTLTSLRAKQENSKIIDKSNKLKIYEFNTFLDAGKFVLRFFDEIPNPNNKNGVCACRHAWPLFGMSANDYSLLQKLLSKTKYYELIKFETPLDKVFGKTLQDLGKVVKFGQNIGTVGDTIIKGDYVLQVFYEKDFLSKFDKIFAEHIDLNQLNLNKLMESFSIYKTPITVTITHDKTIADEYRTQILTYF